MDEDMQLVSALSNQGAIHKENDMPNQDYVVKEVFRSNKRKKYTLLVVCDGVSASLEAETASRFLGKTAKKIFEAYVKKYGDRSFNIRKLKKIIDSLYFVYMSFIQKGTGNLKDYGSTMEMIVIYQNKAYCFHAGDGMILTMNTKGEVLMSSVKNHSGSDPGAVYPFYQKEKWDFFVHNDVCAAMAMSDGASGELFFAPILRNGYLFDPLVLLPFLDVRFHKNEKSFLRYQKSYIKKALDDTALMYKGFTMLDLCKGTDMKEVKKHFEEGAPLRRFLKVNKDDATFAFWTNFDTLPEKYDLKDKIPDYYEIWKRERI